MGSAMHMSCTHSLSLAYTGVSVTLSDDEHVQCKEERERELEEGDCYGCQKGRIAIAIAAVCRRALRDFLAYGADKTETGERDCGEAEPVTFFTFAFGLSF